MVCNYSRDVWTVIMSMVISGAARSVVVKLAYQRGFEAPLTVTMLYLLGQALSLFVFWAQKFCARSKSRTESMEEWPAQTQSEDKESGELETSSEIINPIVTKLGSAHGLTEESEKAIQWIHRIPYYAKPIIPSFFNLMNSFLRWVALIYVAASVAEMLIAGIELTLSVLAARMFRKRLVSRERWIGVAFVTVGIVVIGFVDYRSSSGEAEVDTGDSQENSTNSAAIGIALIVGRCIVAVLQDLTEELFMQASDFPPTLLLGLEGVFGIIFGFILFFFFGKNIGEDFPVFILDILRANPQKLAWIFGLPLLFLVTGIFNIKTTEVTSSMTRNVWKNLRSLLVWVLSLIIFYASGNSSIGEKWKIPDSFYTLIGFFLMTVGIFIYYSQKQKEDNDEEKGDNDEENGDNYEEKKIAGKKSSSLSNDDIQENKLFHMGYMFKQYSSIHGGFDV